MKRSIQTMALVAVICSLTADGLLGAEAAASGAPSRLEWSYQYDDAGRLSRYQNPGGQETTLEYETHPGQPHRLKSLTRRFPGGLVVYEFDPAGWLARMTDTLGAVAYGYDDRGRLNHVQRQGSHAITYTHDSLDRITRLQVGDFYRIDYIYDFLGRLASMKTPAGEVTYEYQTGLGMVIRSLPNGVKTFWKSRPNGELEQITHGFFKNPKDQHYAVLAQYTYEHGPDGRITAIHERSPQGDFSKQYAYDNMGRLVRATGPGGKVYGYSYDAVGNRITATATGSPGQTSAYDWAGRLTSVNGQPCAYDASGNLSKLTLNGVTRQYRYHPDGRLAEAQEGGESVRYGYDGFGRMVSRKAAAREWRFSSDPLSSFWQPLVIANPGGAQTLVIWDGRFPLALARDGSTEWLLHDHLGSTRVLTDAKGNVVRYREYNAFGVSVDKAAEDSLAPGFSGLFRDGFVNGYLTWARAFLPEMGSFLQPDPQKHIPTAAVEELAFYAYCGGDPVNWIDLDGARRSPAHLGPAYSPEHAGIGPRISESDWNDAMSKRTHNQRVDAYIEKWREVHGPGPVAIMIRGVNHRARDGEAYAEAHFPGKRVIVLWSYEGPVRWLDAVRTAVDRMSPFRNVDLSHLQDFVENRGMQLKYSIFESGASHNWQKNADTIIRRAADGKSTPVYIVTSANSGDLRKLEEMKSVGTTVYNFTDIRGDAVYDLTRHFRNYLNPIQIPVLREITQLLQSTSHKVGSVLFMPVGMAFPEQDHIKGIRGHAGEEHLRKINTLLEGIENPRAPAPIGPEPGVNSPSLDASRMEQSRVFTDLIMRQMSVARAMVAEYDVSGGPGRVAGPGGFASPDAYAALDEFRRRTASSPSPVGGVYLGGAGGLLDGVGMVKGLRLDSNGDLVLLAEEDGAVALPPLRLDDMVTVFRSVYLHGEGPTVTIDPNPEDPEKSAMIIVHSEATKGTYVGWVLYQADRLMKGYTQGVDNMTTNDITSRVPGYPDVLETIYFGGADPRRSQKEGIWERFWIVPAEAQRFLGRRRELTLFDVPLKVNTQKMKWAKDRLVDDVTGKSSPGALAFTSWFTTNYNGIAAEQYLFPPKESGITEPVPVFLELRRIALMTAIAEKLRDDGVPMPFWMREYEVPQVPFERFTPGLEVTRTRRDGNTIRTARIFGGVQLSAETSAVKAYATVGDVAQAPIETRAEVQRTLQLAADLEHVVAETVPPASVAPLSVHRLDHGNRQFQAVAVPGANTLALNPCRLEEVDLIVPLANGRDIRLVRHFNSFFNPKGPWGRGWTMNLPRLEEIRIPARREGGRVAYTTAYELLTAHNSLYARFKDVRAVPELGGSRLQVPNSDGPFHGLANARPEFLNNVETRVLYLKNGQEWHFTDEGHLIAIKDGPQITVYDRAPGGRVPRIVGLWGGALAARIDLEYDSQGRLEKAVGSLERPDAEPVEVRYAYDPSGQLSALASDEGTVGYTYEGPRVASITWTDPGEGATPVILSAFDYNERGQVVSETRSDQHWTRAASAVPGGVEATVTGAADGDGRVVTRYDQQMRPVEATGPDGTRTAWVYQPDGGVQATVTLPDDRAITVLASADGRQRTVRASDSPTLAARFDDAGRLLELRENKQVVLTRQWRPDGQPARTDTETQGVSYRYNERGLLSSVLLHPPGAGQSIAEWQETWLDRRTNPVEVKDYTGLHLQLGYDASGALEAAVQVTPEGNMGYRIERDQAGRIQAVTSSWGNASHVYAADGSLERVQTVRRGRSASVELTGGLVRKVTAYDGGVTSYDYHDQGDLAGAPRSVICANGLILAYDHDPDGRLHEVAVGNHRRVRLGYDEAGRVASYAWEPFAAAP